MDIQFWDTCFVSFSFDCFHKSWNTSSECTIMEAAFRIYWFCLCLFEDLPFSSPVNSLAIIFVFFPFNLEPCFLIVQTGHLLAVIANFCLLSFKLSHWPLKLVAWRTSFFNIFVTFASVHLLSAANSLKFKWPTFDPMEQFNLLRSLCCCIVQKV